MTRIAAAGAGMTEQSELIATPADAPAAPTDIFTLLRRKYAQPEGEWVFMAEVAARPAGGGFADGVAVNTWRSRGHAVHGFEVKVSRADWLRELKSPAKAEPVFRYCDYWFLVAEKDIVKPGELPAAWGHLERRGASLHVVKAAPKLTPEPSDLRRAGRGDRRQEIRLQRAQRSRAGGLHERSGLPAARRR